MGTPAGLERSHILRDPRLLLAYGLGSGLAPVAPGTFGTLAAVPVYLLLMQLPWYAYLTILALMLVWGVRLCGYAAGVSGDHDSGGVVWDEWVGFLLTMTVAPPGWLWIGAGLCLFRLFDIWKPWPIRAVDRSVGGGLGVMLDDVLAGAYAWLVLQGLSRVLV